MLELRQKIDDLETQLLARDADCRNLRSAALAKDAELIRRSADHSSLRLQVTPRFTPDPPGRACAVRWCPCDINLDAAVD